jgi:nitroreductase
MLGIPEGIRFMFMLPVGYSEKDPNPTPRTELIEMVYREKYGRK